MPILNSEIPKARVVKGVSAPVVIVGGSVIIAALGVALYLLSGRLGLFQFELKPARVPQPVRQAERVVESPAPAEPTQPAAPAVNEETQLKTQQKVVPASKDTYDIGAYLTYGGQAYMLQHGIARLSADKRRLAVGLFENIPESGKSPALAVMFEFHKPLDKCAKKNIKEMTLIFNLKPLGNIAAQQVQEVRKTTQEIDSSLTDFKCDLKPGGRLDMHLLGASQTLLRPSGTAFGWGVRLGQVIR